MKLFTRYTALVAVLVMFFGFYCTPLWDMDFWWHIATGRHILETHTIPDHDPFGMYAASGLRNDMILKSYWLSQATLFLTFNWWGGNGVIFLKAGILTLCLATIYSRSILMGAGEIFSLLVLSCVGASLVNFTGERPQLFSFLFFSIAVLLLDYSRERQIKWPMYLLPPVMLLWANSHGGVVLGGVVLGMMAVTYAVEDRLFGSHRFCGKWFIAILAVATLCTLVSPNGIDIYSALIAFQLGEGELRDRTSEYMSPIVLWREMGMMLPFYWGFILLTLAALPKVVRKPDFAPLLVTTFLGILSLISFRYIPFYILFASPYVSLGLTRWFGTTRLPVIPLNGAIVAIALFTLGYSIKHEQAFQRGMQENRFPQGAVAFMQKNNLAGKVFNTFAWGGYLTWYLYPRSQFFIDGRVLDSQPFREYTHILWATPYGIQQLDEYGFDFVLIQYANAFTGEQYKLNNYLLQNSQWQVIYRDQLGYLFARNRGGFSQ